MSNLINYTPNQHYYTLLFSSYFYVIGSLFKKCIQSKVISSSVHRNLMVCPRVTDGASTRNGLTCMLMV